MRPTAERNAALAAGSLSAQLQFQHRRHHGKIVADAMIKLVQRQILGTLRPNSLFERVAQGFTYSGNAETDEDKQDQRHEMLREWAESAAWPNKNEDRERDAEDRGVKPGAPVEDKGGDEYAG